MVINFPPAVTLPSGAYTSYVAVISQAGAAAPTETIQYDTITGGVWSRLLAGIYQFTKVGAFQVAKTWCVIDNNTDQGTFTDGTYLNCRRINNNVVEVRTAVYNLVANTLTLTDGVLLNTPLEIRIYP